MYKREQEPNNMIRWELVSKMENFPDYLDLGIHTLPFFAPDFSIRLGCDFEKKQFVIYDNFTNQEKIRISKDFMTFKDNDDLKRAMRRFMLIDSETIRLLSEEGVEKIVSFAKGRFEELAFNKIPLFNVDYIDDLDSGHYYFKKPDISPTEPDSTKQRLIRRYQEIKGEILLEKKNPETIYNEVFSIDQGDPRFIDQSFNFMLWAAI